MNQRKKLPDRRRQWTQKVKLSGQTIYVCFGEYEDGTLGEIFIDASKQGTFVRGILDSFARMTSLAIQCGTPLEEVVKVLKGMRFPPDGESLVSDGQETVTSIVDWIAKTIEFVYIQKGSKDETTETESHVSSLSDTEV